MSTKLPFYAYSSYNKRGGKQHPVVTRRMNQVLDLYAALITIDTIADRLEIPTETIRSYIRRAKRVGDPRANRHGLNRKRIKARTRRIQVGLLSRAGFTPAEIAKHLECTRRLVQMRLKEAENA
jgi:DNA-binding CsgD family transcriptional regulator